MLLNTTPFLSLMEGSRIPPVRHFRRSLGLGFAWVEPPLVFPGLEGIQTHSGLSPEQVDLGRVLIQPSCLHRDG